METKFIEATDATEFNHGKFMIGRWTPDEWGRQSAIGGYRSLLYAVGWCPYHILVFDLQTGEGGIFRPGGSAPADLAAHAIWVCPMYEPFLAWLYTQDLTSLSNLPGMVNLGNVPISLSGYRRTGWKKR
jgi:hypothetical protein